MGKIPKSSGLDDVRVKVPRNSNATPCGPELTTFLACLDSHGGDEKPCIPAREALGQCMGVASKTMNRWTHKAPINFHIKKVCR